MGKKQCKIEQLGLSETVEKLLTGGVTTRKEVTARLRDDHGADISEATVGRYLAKLKAFAGDKAHRILSDHVDEQIPEDLEALETMQALAYKWAVEAETDQADRIAASIESLSEEINQWRDLLLNSETPASKLISQIIKKCLSYFKEDAAVQEQRLKAMRMASSIIDLKLSKAGLLDDDQKGRIVILQRDEASGLSDNQDTSAVKPASWTPKLVSSDKKRGIDD